MAVNRKFKQCIYDYFNYDIILDKHYNYRIIHREDGYLMPITFQNVYMATNYLDKIISNILPYFKENIVDNS